MEGETLRQKLTSIVRLDLARIVPILPFISSKCHSRQVVLSLITVSIYTYSV